MQRPFLLLSSLSCLVSEPLALVDLEEETDDAKELLSGVLMESLGLLVVGLVRVGMFGVGNNGGSWDGEGFQGELCVVKLGGAGGGVLKGLFG